MEETKTSGPHKVTIQWSEPSMLRSRSAWQFDQSTDRTGE